MLTKMSKEELIKYITELQNEIENLHAELRMVYNEKQDLLEKFNKLQKVWKDFEELYGQFMIPVEGNRTLVKKLMIDCEIDNDYYEKEEI